jgi:hypothetical protein
MGVVWVASVVMAQGLASLVGFQRRGSGLHELENGLA